jgi:hypothetical protein
LVLTSSIDVAGAIDISGTPANNQLATWTDADTLSGEANLIFDGSSLMATASVYLSDDKKLYFGTGEDASFEYDEDGTDTLLYAGSSLRISDDVKLEFGTGGDAHIEYDEDGSDMLIISGPAGGISITGSVTTHLTGASNPTGLSNNTSVGEVVYFGTGSVSQGRLAYLNSDGGWQPTDASATGSDAGGGGNASLLGIPLLAGDPREVGMMVRGYCNADWMFTGVPASDNWATGSTVYISGSDGKLTTTPPYASNSYVRAVGYCTDTPTVIYFDPDKIWIENE